MVLEERGNERMHFLTEKGGEKSFSTTYDSRTMHKYKRRNGSRYAFVQKKERRTISFPSIEIDIFIFISSLGRVHIYSP